MNDTIFGSKIRRQIIFYIIIGFAALCLFQLFRMQVLTSSVYEEKSNENSVKGFVQKAPRGIFYDRNLNYLVGNKPSYSVEITPSIYDENYDSIIEKTLGIDSGYIAEIFNKYKRFSIHSPRKIKRGVNYASIVWLEEQHENLKGVNYRIETERDYSFGVKGSNMFGYINEIDAEKLKLAKDVYSLGDYVGNTGLEKAYEYLLRGSKGVEYFVVDSRQKIIKRYEEGKLDVSPKRGYDLVLSIDSHTQQTAEKLLEGKKGALVAIEPKTGDILAFVSAPMYDLSKFGTVTSGEIWSSLKQDSTKPMFNRATMSRNPPGSTYKMVIALAALETGVITTEDYITCTGSFKFGIRSFKCTHVHGKVNVVSAIEKSCNSFFYQLILKVGLEKFAEYSREVGFGKKTGVDIDEESEGIVPDADYFDRAYGKGEWTRGFLISLGIGQGDIITTPIQLAQYCAILANKGHTKQPHFLRGWINEDTGEFHKAEYEEVNADIGMESLQIVTEGMYRVVQGKGTATFIRQKNIEIAGKTGTAQNPHGEDHAIFIGYAPFDNPKIAVAAIVENAGYGSTHAAPIVRDIIKAYLEDKNESGKLISYKSPKRN